MAKEAKHVEVIFLINLIMHSHVCYVHLILKILMSVTILHTFAVMGLVLTHRALSLVSVLLATSSALTTGSVLVRTNTTITIT